MAERSERIEARVSAEGASRIRFASELLHTSVSGFMVSAAIAEAERVITEASYTEVPNDYFNALIAALDEPPRHIETLSKAAAKVRIEPAFKQVN